MIFTIQSIHICPNVRVSFTQLGAPEVPLQCKEKTERKSSNQLETPDILHGRQEHPRVCERPIDSRNHLL